MNNLWAKFEFAVKRGIGERFLKGKPQEDIRCLCKQAKIGLFCQIKWLQTIFGYLCKQVTEVKKKQLIIS